MVLRDAQENRIILLFITLELNNLHIKLNSIVQENVNMLQIAYSELKLF